MFREAYALARNFTFPIIITQQTASARIECVIGAYVVINAEGWIATAGHIVEHIRKCSAQVDAANKRIAEEARIRADNSLDHKARTQQLRALGKAAPDDVIRYSEFWGGHQGSLSSTLATVDGVDFGVAKLDPTKAQQGIVYPVFKDPTKNFEPGTSLCKIGYPFHSIAAKYNSETDNFELPPGALPVPMFPLEGIFTRLAVIHSKGVPLPAVIGESDAMWVETSSPGLRGQSGGPTVDVRGTIWAIQVQTSHLALGFNTKIAEQYLHVGLGVHPRTMFKVFDQVGIKYQVSDY